MGLRQSLNGAGQDNVYVGLFPQSATIVAIKSAKHVGIVQSRHHQDVNYSVIISCLLYTIATC